MNKIWYLHRLLLLKRLFENQKAHALHDYRGRERISAVIPLRLLLGVPITNQTLVSEFPPSYGRVSQIWTSEGDEDISTDFAKGCAWGYLGRKSWIYHPISSYCKWKSKFVINPLQSPEKEYDSCHYLFKNELGMRIKGVSDSRSQNAKTSTSMGNNPHCLSANR